jgi:hypothetical protein
MRIDGRGAAMHLFDIGMVAGFREHARDDAALLGHLQAFLNAKLFYP